jgi:hypothetical protein
MMQQHGEPGVIAFIIQVGPCQGKYQVGQPGPYSPTIELRVAVDGNNARHYMEQNEGNKHKTK